MEKFSLFPSFSPSDKGDEPNLSTPPHSNTEQLSEALSLLDGEDGTLSDILPDQAPPAVKETDAQSPILSKRPDAMLNLLSAHEKALAKIRGKK